MIPLLALRVAFVVGLIAVLVGFGWWARGVKADRDVAQLTERWTAESHKAIQAAYAETERRLAAQKEITDAANLRARQASRDAGAAATAALSLRSYADSLAERAAACYPSAADPGASARAAGLVLADMLKRLEERGRAAAGALDASFGAGIACEQAYESLSAR